MKHPLLILLLFLILLSHSCNTAEELLVLGGYEDGSIVDYILKVYPDSTFLLQNISDLKGSCIFQGDTIIFLIQGDTCARVVKTELISQSCSELRILKQMEFVKREPPAPIKFPN